MRRKLRKDWTCVQTFGILKPLAEVQAGSARFGTIKAQTLSNQVELVLVFIIIRWSRFDGSPLGILRPNKKCQPSILL